VRKKKDFLDPQKLSGSRGGRKALPVIPPHAMGAHHPLLLLLLLASVHVSHPSQSLLVDIQWEKVTYRVCFLRNSPPQTWSG